jgi:hypothetical protein
MFCTTPPLRSVPRPIREGLSIAFGASRLIREVVFEEVNLEQLQVEFRVEEKTLKMT